MAALSRTTVGLFLAGAVFLLAGFRDRYWPGRFTLNSTPPSREEIAIAMTLGLVFLGAAGFRLIRSGPHS